MGFVVKNTTNFGLLDLLCPHTCRGCGRLGAVICECCKKNLLAQRQEFCPICKQMVAKSAKKVINIGGHQIEYRGCKDCEPPFLGLWCFGWREGVLEKLVEEYKYQSVRAMSKTLVELYDVILPAELTGARCRDGSVAEMMLTNAKMCGATTDTDCHGLELLSDIVLVPLPTIGKHIRERGFDHTLTVAKKLAKLRGWRYQQLLARAIDTVQVGSKMSDRKTQADKAYVVRGKIDARKHYLLLDDVWTTGATMLAAEKVLRAAGAENISAVVLAVSKLKTD